jgi:hypothetical protein
VGLWWHPARHSNYLLGFLIGALVAATFAWVSWVERSDYLKLEQAEKAEADLQDDGELAAEEPEL